jgi:hypothetical protein
MIALKNTGFTIILYSQVIDDSTQKDTSTILFQKLSFSYRFDSHIEVRQKIGLEPVRILIRPSTRYSVFSLVL